MYLITKETQAMKRIQKGIYRTKIYEKSTVKYSVYSPKKIIDYNCTINGASLAGRIETVMKVLGTKSKLPIPVVPKTGLFLFPTSSMKNSNCIILSFYHVKKYAPHGKYANVQLLDQSEFLIKTSLNQFDLQMKRTSQVIAYYNRLYFL